MSDWLEDQLSQHLKPVAAPEKLRVRLGFAPPRRRVFPPMAVAIAAAVLMMMAGGLAASRTGNFEAVEFANSDPGAMSVWLGHSTGKVSRSSDSAVLTATAAKAADSNCIICHTL